MELYDDYSVSMVKKKINDGTIRKDNFDIRIGTGKAAAISITQTNSLKQTISEKDAEYT